MSIKRIWLGLAVVISASSGVLADDFYFHVPVRSLHITEGKLPAGSQTLSKRWQLLPVMHPYAVLDGAGEVYITDDSLQPWAPRLAEAATVAIRASTSRVTGRLFVPNEDLTGMIAVKFSVTETESKPESQQEFVRARESHYRRLHERNIPGSAWFRIRREAPLNAMTFNPGVAVGSHN